MEQKKGAHDALIHTVEAGLIAMQEGQLGGVGEGGEGGGDAGDLAAGLGGFDALIEEAGLDGPGAAKAPESGRHFLDHAAFDAIGGAEFPDVLGNHQIEVRGGLIGEDHLFGEQAMPEGVEGGALFAGDGFGSP